MQGSIDAQSQGHILVDVNAVTGATRVRESAVHAIGEDFREYICLRVDVTPTACCQSNSGTYGCNLVPGAEIAWQEFNEASTECTASHPAVNCNDPSLLTPKDILATIEVQWELSVGNQSSVCCHGVGGADNRIDVVVGTPATQTAHYNPVSRNIVIPPHPPGQPELSHGRSAELLAHELTHGLQHLNFDFQLLYGQDDFGSALMEGLADAMSATMAEKITWPGFNWGQAWIIGDGQPPILQGPHRNLTDEQTFTRMYNTSLSYHDRGMAAANFMYRIKSSFDSVTRFIEFEISVMRHLQDGHSSGFDLRDFRDAIDRSIKPGETEVLNRINEVWAVMDDTVVVTPPSPPDAPWFVDGTPLGCEAGYSVYSLGWTNVSEATEYDIWYYYNGGLYFETTVNASPIFVYTTINADMRVKACNNYGCSPLSADGYWVIHNQCP